MVDVEDVVEAISAAGTLDELQALLPQLAGALGVSHVVYHAMNVASSQDVSRPVFLLTYSNDWVSRYFAERYIDIDPIVREGQRAFLPLDWSSVETRQGRVVDFFRDAERHGIGKHGVTIPIRGPRGERALFTINAHSTFKEWTEKRRLLMPHFHMLGHFVHERAMRLNETRQDTLPMLSVREVQCLQRAAVGGTQKTIAWELNLSESAVNLYLKAARRKLGAATLAQAVSAAVSLEMIDHRLANSHLREGVNMLIP